MEDRLRAHVNSRRPTPVAVPGERQFPIAEVGATSNWDHFREQVRTAHRGNYQTLINDALRDYLRRPTIAQQVGAEVRSVVLREELGKAKISA